MARILKLHGLAEAKPERLDVSAIHARHAEFVWASLSRLGVPSSDLPDLLQEVFLVVHRRLGSLEPEAPVRGWLFGICHRLVLNYRRKAHRRREESSPRAAELAQDRGRSPESEASRRQARETLARLLDELDPDKRAVFVMFEIEELSCPEIAEQLGLKVGTVYSRLHAARGQLTRVLERWRLREEVAR